VPSLSQLLDVQDLDLSSDQLHERRRTMPEREALRASHTEAAALDEAHTALIERRETLSNTEHDLGSEVATVAAKAKEVEDALYSGSVKVPKELEALQEELRLLRARQSGIEEQEMELLEEIELCDGEIVENRSAHTGAEARAAELEAAIRAAETEIEAELTQVAARRGAESSHVPAPILAEYDRLRGKERMAGRAAARLADGSCQGCRVKLPVLEYNRMKAEPEDTLLCCVHCGRVLVR